MVIIFWTSVGQGPSNGSVLCCFRISCDSLLYYRGGWVGGGVFRYSLITILFSVKYGSYSPRLDSCRRSRRFRIYLDRCMSATRQIKCPTSFCVAVTPGGNKFSVGSSLCLAKIGHRWHNRDSSQPWVKGFDGGRCEPCISTF